MPTTPPLPKQRPVPVQLPSLLAFTLVARHLNFARAAEDLGVSPTAMSKTIKGLEEQLNTRLFNRTTRSVSLTDVGSELLRALQPALEQIRTSVDQVVDSSGTVRGELRLNTSYVAYAALLEPHVNAFLERHPEVSLDLEIDNGLSDIVAQGFDAGIRLGQALQKDMIGAPVGPPQELVVVASPSYLLERGVPQTPQDLLAHQCVRQRIGNGGRHLDWTFQEAGRSFTVGVSGRYTASEMRCALDAARSGYGLAYVFRSFAGRAIAAGEVRLVLEQYALPRESFFIYYPSRSRMPAKLRAFIDFLQAAHWAPP